MESVQYGRERVYTYSFEKKGVVIPKTLVISDVDMSLYDRDGSEGSDGVRGQVAILNSECERMESNGHMVKFSFLSARPAEAFLDTNSPVSYYLGGLVNIATSDGGRWTIVSQALQGLEVVGCELGSVMLVRDLVEPDDQSNTHWTVQIHPQYVQYAITTREVLRKILQEKFVDSGEYQFEQGTQVLLALQRQDNAHMSPEEKEEVLRKIHDVLKTEGLENLLDDVEVDVEGHDLDLYPKSLLQDSKAIGVKEILRILKERGQEYRLEDVVMVDDSFKPVRTAFPMVAEAGGWIASPANRSKKLEGIMKEFKSRAITSHYPIFWGVVSALRGILLNERLTVPWIEFRKFLEYNSEEPTLVFVGTESSCLASWSIDEVASKEGRGLPEELLLGMENTIKLDHVLELSNSNATDAIVEAIKNEPTRYRNLQLIISTANEGELENTKKMLLEIANIYSDLDSPKMCVRIFRTNALLNLPNDERTRSYELKDLIDLFTSDEVRLLKHLTSIEAIRKTDHSLIENSNFTMVEFLPLDRDLVSTEERSAKKIMMHHILALYENLIFKLKGVVVRQKPYARP